MLGADDIFLLKPIDTKRVVGRRDIGAVRSEVEQYIQKKCSQAIPAQIGYAETYGKNPYDQKYIGLVIEGGIFDKLQEERLALMEHFGVLDPFVTDPRIPLLAAKSGNAAEVVVTVINEALHNYGKDVDIKVQPATVHDEIFSPAEPRPYRKAA
jgi:hypothetical protein